MANRITSGEPDGSLVNEQVPMISINEMIQELLGYNIDSISEAESRQFKLNKTLWQRETHSKLGEHVFLSFNDHSESKHLVPAQYFIQVYGIQHSKNNPQIIDDIRWTEHDDPTKLFADNLARIEELLGLFKTVEPSNNG